MTGRWNQKLEGVNLRRALPWLVTAGIVLLVFVVLGPGFAMVRDAEEGDEPAPQFSFEEPADAAPASIAALPAGPEVELEEWGLPEDELAEPPPVEPSAADATTTLDCIIEPSEMVDVRSPVRGRIDILHVERGDAVERGQVLVELESSVEQAAAEVARARSVASGEVESRAARLDLGVRKQDRAEKLYSGDALSVDQRDEAETEAEVARLELRQARENLEMAGLELQRALAVLERRSIRSPISGFVVDRLMSVGEVVDEETILHLAQIDPLRVEVILPSAMYGSIRTGTRAAVVPEVPGDRVHVASVAIVDPVIDAASGTFGVRLELSNPDHSIPGGLRCQVRFLTD